MLIILATSSYQRSSGISFFLQKETYSNNNLFKNSTPNFEISSRSSIECFTICQILFGNDCKSFKYEKEKKLCSLYKEVIRCDSNKSVSGSYVGYQIYPG